MIKRLLTRIYQSSPKSVVEGLRSLASPKTSAPQLNSVLDGIVGSSAFPTLTALSISRISKDPWLIAGDPETTSRIAADLRSRGVLVEERAAAWGDTMDTMISDGKENVALCLVPSAREHWETVSALKRRLGSRLFLITELLLPYTLLSFLQSRLDYHVKEFERILGFYLGEKFFGGPLEKLEALFSLRGRSVIEFGPCDGGQTAGLVHLGAAAITCIEARAENAAKTRAAAEVFHWEQVRVIMDDFHNADATKYGRFDLAFAHGVYYHSIASFVFLENLRSLSDNIFLGGYCATDDLPASPWLDLTHENRTYRVKEYRENDIYTGGVNRVSYFFHGDDLIRFFTERGHRVQVISDQVEKRNAGRFLRLFIQAP